MNAHQTFSQELATAHFVVQALQDAGITPEDPDFETLVDSECDAIERLRRMLRAARWAEKQAEAAKQIEAEIKERRQRFEAKGETLRTIVKQAMEQIGLPKIEAPDMTASLSAGRPAVVIDDEESIPSQLCKIVRSPDKAAIKKALEQGETIPGAHLAPSSNVLTVRTK